MSIFIIPALIALVIKLAVLYASWRSQRHRRLTSLEAALPNSTASSVTAAGGHERKSPDLAGSARSTVLLGSFTTLVLMMSGHNLAELLFYFEYSSGAAKENLLRWYYLMAILSLGVLVLYAQSVSQLHNKQSTIGQAIKIIALCSAVVLGGLIMFTDLLVSGAHSIGYSMTATQGPMYYLFHIFSLLAYAVVFAYLINGYTKSESHQSAIQCGYTLVALLPIILTSLALIVLMKLGYEVNAALVMPLATAMFLVITLMGERAHGMFDVRRFIPMSLENRTANQIMEIFSQYTQDKCSYREALTDIERMLVLHKHEKHGGNVSSTAASMDMPRSSLYSIFRRLDIDLGEIKEERRS